MSNSPNQEKGSGRLVAGTLILFVWLAPIVFAAVVGWSVAEFWAFPWAGLCWGLGLLLLPLGFSMALERVLEASGRKLHAERVLPLAVWVLAVASIAVALLRFPQHTARALLANQESGWAGQAHRALGRLLLGASSNATTQPETEAGRAESSAARHSGELGLPDRGPANDTGALPPGTATRPLSEASAGANTGLPSAEGEPAPSLVQSEQTAAAFAAGDPSYRDATQCDTLSDVGELPLNYDAADLRKTAEELLRRRYPVGLAFVQAQDDTTLRTWFSQGTGDFDAVVTGLEAAVHEGAHLWSAKHFNGRSKSYQIAEGVELATRWHKTFDRSEIVPLHVDAASDTYASTYLSGASGAQNFNTLLDEFHAYVHSLAYRVCTRDLLPSNQSVSSRDGVLTMMYYVELYLGLARTAHPKDYAAILADDGERRMVTLVWDRAEYWLRKSAPYSNLGINADRVAAWVYEPQRLDEVARVRASGVDVTPSAP